MVCILIDGEPACDERQPGKSGGEEEWRSPLGSNSQRYKSTRESLEEEKKN